MSTMQSHSLAQIRLYVGMARSINRQLICAMRLGYQISDTDYPERRVLWMNAARRCKYWSMQ